MTDETTFTPPWPQPETSSLAVKMSPTIGNLAGALSAVQHEIHAPGRAGKGGHGSYVTLDGVITAIREPLSQAGLAFIQLPTSDERGQGLTTILTHQSGEWIMGTMVIPVDEVGRGRNLAQECGSTLTYMRRYSLMALLGLPSEDDDGASAGSPRKNTTKRHVGGQDYPDPKPGNGVTEGQTKMWFALTRKLDIDEEKQAMLLDKHGVKKFDELPRRAASELLDHLKKREKQAAKKEEEHAKKESEEDRAEDTDPIPF